MEKATSDKICTAEAVELAIQAIFMQYSTYHCWEQIDCEPWMDVYGNEHPTKLPESWTLFLE